MHRSQYNLRSSSPRRLAGALTLPALGLLALGLPGCGARSGLEVPDLDGGPDAGIDGGPDAGVPVRVPEILVTVTVDNSYRFAFGSETELREAEGAAEAGSACDIFCCSRACARDDDCGGPRCGPLGACEDGLGAEVYRVPEGRATSSDFLYVVAWSDDAVTQGLLAEIRTEAGRVVRSGDAGWAVCATGRDYDSGSGGPPEEEVTDWLARCARGDTPSGGWVLEASSGPSLAIGETNAGAEGDFPETCLAEGPGDRIGPEARWMWFDADAADGGDPFREPEGEFLIFRLPTRALTE